jgi:hypothetical protein
MRPPSWAERGVALAAHVLPAGATRERYRQEFVAELYGLNRREAAAYTLGVLVNAWALRAVIFSDSPVAKEATMHTDRPLTCRLSIHHTWHTYSTEDGSRYRQCSRCGKYAPSINHPGDGAVYPVN